MHNLVMLLIRLHDVGGAAIAVQSMEKGAMGVEAMTGWNGTSLTALLWLICDNIDATN